MRQSGRVSLLTIIALLGVAMVVVLLFLGKEGPGPAGTRFMDALARGDVKTLTNLTYLGDKTPEQIQKEWEFATTVPGKHYLFRWRVVDATQAAPGTGAVRVMVERNIGTGGSYEEKFELPMREMNGKWKVEAGGISREMYPGLPRADQ